MAQREVDSRIVILVVEGESFQSPTGEAFDFATAVAGTPWTCLYAR